MRTPRLRSGVLIALALTLAACGGGTDEELTAQPEVESEVAETDEVEEGDTGDEPTPTSEAEAPTTSELPEDDVAEGDEAPEEEAEPDPNASPPTTETAGLAGDAEAPPVPDDLTCWRVEDFGEEAADR